MSRDPKNYFQETPNQIRIKVKGYLNNPRYYIPEMRKKGLLKPKKKNEKKE